MTQKALFLFRRDLRLIDNTALNAALNSGREVIATFILDPRQVEPHPYRSTPGMQFMFESLCELDKELRLKGSKLHIFFGQAEAVLDSLLLTGEFDLVFINRDYTPFSTKRDEALHSRCKNRGATLSPYHDTLLTEPKLSVKDDGKPYTVFTPFFKRNSKNPPAHSAPLSEGRFGILKHTDLKDISYLDTLLPSKNDSLFQKGGRTAGLSLISKINLLGSYNSERDIPILAATSGLSAHHKFGTCSIRESYWAAKKNLPSDNRFISELYWRDFFTQIGYFFPHVFQGPFQKRFNNVLWDDNEDGFQKWCCGETGFPIVDAGMRELNKTGYMHNRVRMIVSSFLMKDLHISWQRGEKYFAQKLTDYDPAVNNGSWQWAASTGCDAQPYFRIFNPWLQQAKFDPDARYIKLWIPELKDCPPKMLHNLFDLTNSIPNYPKPILEHGIEKKIAEERYAECAKL